MIKKTLKFIAILLATLVMIGTATLYWQAQQKPEGTPTLVALGSSFAAGIGLGERASGSPFVCQRSRNGYPQQLAHLRNLPLVDMSCSAATSHHVRDGGQVFLGPQLDGLSPQTQWVTLTIGGNDVSYVGDLSFLAGRESKTLTGWAVRQLWGGARKPEDRDFDQLHRDLVSTLAAIRQRAPRARIMVATYPAILPLKGTCAKLSLSEAEAEMMRAVGDKLADVTLAAAREGSAIGVDLHRLGVGHDACSAEPWVNGWNDVAGTPFHPTLAGANAAASAISAAMDQAVKP